MGNLINYFSAVQSTVDNKAVTNNNIYLTTDTHEVYYDINGERICVSTLIQLVSEAELLATLAPISNKLYFVKDTNKLFIYNNEWVELTGTTATSGSSIEACLLNIRIPSDSDDNLLVSYIELSESADFSNPIAINSTNNNTLMQIATDNAIEAVATSGIPSYAYGCLLLVDLSSYTGVDCSKTYYARARFYDGSVYGVWNSTRFVQCGYIEDKSAITTESTDVDLSAYYTRVEVDALIPDTSAYITNDTNSLVNYTTSSTLTTLLAGYSRTTHNHDSAYYTQATIDSKLSENSGALTTAITSMLTNNYYNMTEVDNKVATKQDTLISSTTIKTINNQSLLGSGNIEITTSTPVATETECILSIAIPSDTDNDVLTCYIELSESIDFSNSTTLNSNDNSSIMEALIDGTGMTLTAGIPSYLYTGTLIVNLHQIDGFDCTKSYYVRVRFYDGTAYGVWNCTKFKYCGYVVQTPYNK